MTGTWPRACGSRALPVHARAHHRPHAPRACDLREQVTKAGGTQPLVRLLKSGSEALHTAASAALEVLTMDGATREQLLASMPACVAPGL